MTFCFLNQKRKTIAGTCKLCHSRDDEICGYKTNCPVPEHLESCADELNGLDAQLGDGDLGVTMVRGVGSF